MNKTVRIIGQVASAAAIVYGMYLGYKDHDETVKKNGIKAIGLMVGGVAGFALFMPKKA